jgi:hypothetical protein
VRSTLAAVPLKSVARSGILGEMVPSRWTWQGPKPHERLWDEFQEGGLSWVHWPEAVTMAQSDPWSLATALLGSRPFRIRVAIITFREGRIAYVSSKAEAAFHVDQDAYIFPALQVLVCVRQSATGGDSKFIDSWNLLSKIRDTNSDLYHGLFRRVRVVRFSDMFSVGPTYSLRLGDLHVIHGGPPPLKNDQLGMRFATAVQNEEPFQLRLQDGDVLVSNNFRLMHGRTAFEDSSRKLVRLLIWLHNPLPAPAPYVEEATLAYNELAKKLQGQPEWLQRRMGVFGPLGREDPIFQHDFNNPPEIPDVTSPERRAELVRVALGLQLGPTPSQ